MCENVRVGGGTLLHRHRTNLTKQNGSAVGVGGVTKPIDSFVFPVIFHI